MDNHTTAAVSIVAQKAQHERVVERASLPICFTLHGSNNNYSSSMLALLVLLLLVPI